MPIVSLVILIKIYEAINIDVKLLALIFKNMNRERELGLDRRETG
jgi:hypothetical protein